MKYKFWTREMVTTNIFILIAIHLTEKYLNLIYGLNITYVTARIASHRLKLFCFRYNIVMLKKDLENVTLYVLLHISA